MTDLTDEYLDALVAKLTDIGKFAIGGGTASEAADVITALRQREATAVAGAIEAAASMTKRIADGYNAGGDAAIGCGLYLTAGNIRSLHTDATRAALDRAKAEGMREAARLIPPAVSGAASIILAAADKLEGKS